MSGKCIKKCIESPLGAGRKHKGKTQENNRKPMGNNRKAKEEQRKHKEKAKEHTRKTIKSKTKEQQRTNRGNKHENQGNEEQRKTKGTANYNKRKQRETMMVTHLGHTWELQAPKRDENDTFGNSGLQTTTKVAHFGSLEPPKLVLPSTSEADRIRKHNEKTIR